MSVASSVLAAKRLSDEQAHAAGVDGPQLKRRRIPLTEVEHELRAAGLSQPALSFMRDIGQRAVGNEALGLLKRGQAEAVPLDMQKRRKVSPKRIPVLLPKAGAMANSLAIVPYRGYVPEIQTLGLGKSERLQLRLASQLTRLAVDPRGVVFEVCQPGLLMTELPAAWQPVVNYKGHRSKVAKVALDSNGTAFFLSAEGELLMMLSAVRYLEGACREDELKLVYLDEKRVEAEMNDDFSPSTFAPSPSMEDATDDDAGADAMEWDAC